MRGQQDNGLGLGDRIWTKFGALEVDVGWRKRSLVVAASGTKVESRAKLYQRQARREVREKAVAQRGADGTTQLDGL